MATHKITNITPAPTAGKYVVTFDVTSVLVDGTERVSAHVYEFSGPAQAIIDSCALVAEHVQEQTRANEAAAQAPAPVPSDILALIGS